ncbi:MAG: CGNR zinc finger domain-containing protein [Acidimicrobiia bacterium]
MTDSTVATAEASRDPAPEPLEVVRQFVNSLDVESGEDELADPVGVRDWFASRGLVEDTLRVKPSDRRCVIEVREALRALLLANNGVALEPGVVDTLNAAAAHAPLEARFDAAGAVEVTGRSGGIDGALGQLMAIVVQAVADGTWARLKACREDDCQWAFYDRSRNRSGQWCVMAVCGNRNKARSYRERQRDG